MPIDAVTDAQFATAWCPPCRVMKPVLDEVAAVRPEVELLTLDVEREPERVGRRGEAAVARDGGEVAQLAELHPAIMTGRGPRTPWAPSPAGP